jgi:hypothetical protein
MGKAIYKWHHGTHEKHLAGGRVSWSRPRGTTAHIMKVGLLTPTIVAQRIQPREVTIDIWKRQKLELSRHGD